MTTDTSDDIIVDMDAILLEHTKQRLADGYILEIVIWQVPEPVSGSSHHFKYRLYFGRDGERIVGFDNERGKGDHWHLDGAEFPYKFSTTDALVRDFRAEISKRRNTK